MDLPEILTGLLLATTIFGEAPKKVLPEVKVAEVCGHLRGSFRESRVVLMPPIMLETTEPDLPRSLLSQGILLLRFFRLDRPPIPGERAASVKRTPQLPLLSVEKIGPQRCHAGGNGPTGFCLEARGRLHQGGPLDITKQRSRSTSRSVPDRREATMVIELFRPRSVLSETTSLHERCLRAPGRSPPSTSTRSASPAPTLRRTETAVVE